MLLDGFYDVLSKSESEAQIKLTDASHPLFKAHFPQNPILPGFVHLDIIEDIFDFEISVIKRAKYSALVVPNEELTYIKEASKVKVLSGEKTVASFSF